MQSKIEPDMTIIEGFSDYNRNKSRNSTDIGFYDLKNIEIIGRYEILHKLGHGGAGTVFLGRDPYIKRQVAVKISNPDSGYREKFFLEAQSAGRLNHPNIVSVYDAGIYKNFCYIAMEYVDGANLMKYCQKDSLLPVPKVLEIMSCLCNAFYYAHNEKVIHRDIKPANIMIDKNGNVKITDFGIAHISGHTLDINCIGTPVYMSPEQIENKFIGHESDIFALGCVLYELLSGKRAFSGKDLDSIFQNIKTKEPESISSIRSDLPSDLEKVINKALAKNKKERYQSCLDFAYHLKEIAIHLSGDIIKDDKIKEIVNYIHHLKFFRNFKPDQLAKLISTVSVSKVRMGKVIVAEGDVNDTLFVILSGNVIVIDKEDQVMASINAGECFGEMAFLTREARTASIVAETNCIIMKITALLMHKLPESIQVLFYKNFSLSIVERLSKKS